MPENNFPKLHNATWPGIVGKGSDSEPIIPFDTLLEKTAAAEVDGVKFDGVDIGLFDEHIGEYLNAADGGKRLADKLAGYNLEAGSLVANVWAGSAMGTKDARDTFVEQVRKACEFGKQLRDAGKQMTQLRGSLAEARRIAESDALTGLANRRAFENKLRRAVIHARESGKPLSLAFCDIDHFKNINDVHGHDVGDRILKFVAQRLASASGNNCFVARHGGEEFVMLFEGLTAEQAGQIVNQVRADLGERRLVAKTSGEPIGQVSFSAGIAALTPRENGRQMLRSADQALYRAKAEGRNRVVILGD